MDTHTVALFGEAEKGDYRTAYFCRTMAQLLDIFGNPPPNSCGLHYAVQALLYQRDLIFFRVREEGFSYQDYLLGLNELQKNETISELSAICLPGVGDVEIIEAIAPLCAIYHSILITNESDFYDYLTELTAH
jgi:hypothetical protein